MPILILARYKHHCQCREMNCSYDVKGWHLCDIYWCVGPHRHIDTVRFMPSEFYNVCQNRARNLGERGSHGGEDNRPPSEVKFFSCVFGCAQGQLRGREGAEWKQEGGWEGCGERERQRMWKREGRMENEWTALGVLKEFHGTAKSFAFSELILDYHLPYRRLPGGLW